MPLQSLLSLGAAYFTLILALVVVSRDWHSFVHRIFAFGLCLLATEEFMKAFAYSTVLPVDVLYWQKRIAAVSTLGPGTWLLVSVTYARVNYRELLARWKWTAIAAFVLPVSIVFIFRRSIFEQSLRLGGAARWILPLGWAGWSLHLLYLFAAILILANLEKTLRASTGRMRWQIKFMVLGIAGLTGLRIYTSSQALLYWQIDTGIESLSTIALLAADVLFIQSLLRTRFTHVDVYLSGATLRRSLTAILVGIYLIVVGFLAHFAQYLHARIDLPIEAFIVFVALTGLGVMLLSDRARQRARRLISRHFRRPAYDYRAVWMDLTQRTASILDPNELCTAMARMISESVEVHSVNIWLLDDVQQRFVLAGSTVFNHKDGKDLEHVDSAAALIQVLQQSNATIDLARRTLAWPGEVMQLKPDYFTRSKLQYIVPLRSVNLLVGMVTLNDDRVGDESLGSEEFELLETLASQLSASLLNLRLSDRLRHAKELEAFQTVSAFFVHDLKNLASRLSLTMQNLPLHFDNPEFRSDALRMISHTLSNIGDMCTRLSMLRQKLELNLVEADLNAVIKSSLDELQCLIKGEVQTDLHPVPKAFIDEEQIRKVFVNLIMNANEAVDSNGRIRISTRQDADAVILAVADNGCGIPQEFLETSLFRPFQTTKKRGIGIGLFHSKLIIDAHKGRIEVKTSSGAGTEFRVVLPAA